MLDVEGLEKFIIGVLLNKPWYRDLFIFHDRDFFASPYGEIGRGIISAPDSACKTPEMMAHLIEKGLSPSTISALLGPIEDKDCYVACSPKQFVKIAGMLREEMVRREMGKFIAEEGNAVDAIIAYANELDALRNKYAEESLLSSFSRYYDSYLGAQAKIEQGESVFLETGLRNFDHFVRLERKDFMALGARTSIGKSLFALWLAVHAAQKGSMVYYLNMEMSSRSVMNRVLGMLAGESVSSYQRYSADPNDAVAGVEVIGQRMILNNTPGITLADVRRFLMAKSHIDILVIDYINLMTDKGDSEHQRLATISNGLKALAIERDCAIIGCCQLNRDSEKGNREPELYDIKDSSGIEQAADIVALMHRDREQYDVKLLVRKHRNGILSEIQYTFDPRTTSYRELDKP